MSDDKNTVIVQDKGSLDGCLKILLIIFLLIVIAPTGCTLLFGGLGIWGISSSYSDRLERDDIERREERQAAQDDRMLRDAIYGVLSQKRIGPQHASQAQFADHLGIIAGRIDEVESLIYSFDIATPIQQRQAQQELDSHYQQTTTMFEQSIDRITPIESWIGILKSYDLEYGYVRNVEIEMPCADPCRLVLIVQDYEDFPEVSNIYTREGSQDYSALSDILFDSPVSFDLSASGGAHVGGVINFDEYTFILVGEIQNIRPLEGR